MQAIVSDVIELIKAFLKLKCALRTNINLIRHSLGLGVSLLLVLLWCDPLGLTANNLCLPQGRRLQVYVFATPYWTDAKLSMRW